LDPAKTFRFAIRLIGPKYFNDTPQANHEPPPEDVTQRS
jgi:hypothetical protein